MRAAWAVLAVAMGVVGCENGEAVNAAPRGLGALSATGGGGSNQVVVACDSGGQARLSAPGRSPIDLLGTVAMQMAKEPGATGVTASQIHALNFGDGFVQVSCIADSGPVVFVVPGNPIVP